MTLIMPEQVVVTGLGLVLPGCDDAEMFWRQVSEGKSQLSLEPDPTADDGRRCPMGVVRNLGRSGVLDTIPESLWARWPREAQLYLASVARGCAHARLSFDGVRPDRVGLFDGVARPTFAFWYDRIRAQGEGGPAGAYGRGELVGGLPGQPVGIAASIFRVRGPAYTFTSTCSSGSVAIGHAFRSITYGECDVAFASGHEASLVPPLFAMYRDANLLSREEADPAHAITPYSGHSTNAFGEGAVTLVLESRTHAEARGATVIAEIAGYRYGNNGYHPTHVDVVGVRPAEVIEGVLGDAGVAPEAVAFVVGHGNGVQLSDVSEENYMRRVFGRRAAEVPLVSTKPIYGHTLGASSAVNAAAAALMVANDFVIPTINADPGRQKRHAWHQPNVGAARPCPAGISASYGMGGHNTALLFRKNSSRESG